MPRINRKGPKLRVGLLASGGGTTILAVLKECAPGGRLHDLVEVAVIIGSKVGIKALNRPKEVPGMEDIPTRVVERKKRTGKTEDQFADELLAIFQEFGVELFCQMGWLPETPEKVWRMFPGTNQHPGPTPLFGGDGMYGVRVHAARLLYMRSIACQPDGGGMDQTVVCQWVGELDQGATIHYEMVPVDLATDTPESLQARALPLEWECQIRGLELLASGREFEMVCPFGQQTVHTDTKTLAWAKNQAMVDYPNG